jgi:predicted RNA methylase
MSLTREQQEQVGLQLQRHNRDSGSRSIQLDKEGKRNLDLWISKGVFGSDLMSSGVVLTSFLDDPQNRELYADRDCLDMGCGPGTMGIIMAKNGAGSVDLLDLNGKAILDTKRNIKDHNVGDRCSALESDLFSVVREKQYGCIVFSHPFFPEEAHNFGQEFYDDEMLRRSMLGGSGTLLRRFFSQLQEGNYLMHLGNLIMYYFHFAGIENNPTTHIRQYGLRVVRQEEIISETSLQKGDFSIYVIQHQGAT